MAENRRAILRLLPRDLGGELLEIGPRDGAFTARVAAHTAAARVVAVELRPERAEAARHLGIDTVLADVETGLAFADGCFRLVHANQVIEHLRATDRFLQAVRRVLEPGGLACISTNNLASWHNVCSLAFGWQPMPAHVSDEVIVGNPCQSVRPRPALRRRARARAPVHTTRAARAVRAPRTPRPGDARGRLLPPAPWLARAAGRIDPGHGAFVTVLVRRAAG